MLGKRTRNNRLVRLTYAGAVGAKVIGSYQVLRLRRKHLSPDEYERRLKQAHRKNAEAIYSGVLDLQGLMIKIGQTLGSRPDVFPEEYSLVLSHLQDSVPPHPFDDMKPYIEKQLGFPIAAIFSRFEPEPIAAASLAQVYDATLRDGRRVAVKAVYPGMLRLIRTDLSVLRAIIWLESRMQAYPLEPVYRELEDNIPNEVDMTKEARHMEELARTLGHRDDVVVPGVIWEHTRKRLLVMEYLDGIKISNLEGLRAAGMDLAKLFTNLVDVYFEKMLVHGYFQADPHPGNLLALPGNRIGLLDFGLTKRFSPEFRDAFAATTRAMFLGDDAGVIAGIKACGFEFKEDDPSPMLAIANFFRAMSDPDTYKDRELMHAVNTAWVDAFKRNPLQDMPGEMTLAMRVFGLLFGIGALVATDIGMPRDAVRNAALKHTGGIPDEELAATG